MRRDLLFGGILVASLAGFAASFYALNAGYQTGSPDLYMQDMMRRMMGETGPLGGSGRLAPPFYLLLLPAVFVGTLIIGVLGLVYSLVIPPIRVSSTLVRESDAVTPALALRGEKAEAVVKTMRPEEEKVFSILVSHGGKFLQKHISREAGLSRLKTHRIVARFAQRGIVTVKPFGNTNEIVVAEWLRAQTPQKEGGESS